MFTKLSSAKCPRQKAPRKANGPVCLATRAFTLIEVVVALTILAMITGTLFAIIQGSVRAAAQIELLQRENDSINRLLDVLRKSFTTLPSTATLTLTSGNILATGGTSTIGSGLVIATGATEVGLTVADGAEL